MNFYIRTFGCQMNDRDTERISSLLYSLGYSQTNDPLNARILILNTCSIRKKAELKAYSALGRFRQLKKDDPSVLIGMGGCVAQQEGRRLLERVPFLDFVFGSHAIHRLPGLIERSLRGERVCETDFTDERRVRFQDYRFFNKEIVPVPCSSYVKSFVTIMEGCDNMCSYCVVPRTRGKETSRPADDILAEIKGLVQRGVKEVTLLGQNVNSYGKKDGFIRFTELLGHIDSIPGLKRLRFTTSHPKDLSEELIASFGRLRSLCPHIHLPLQSGSTRILEKMNRGYSREDYLKKIRSLRMSFQDIAVTTDIIVGFPGEEEKDFENTMEMLNEVRFDGHYSFCFSPRPGTPAASMEPKVPREVGEERLKRVQEFQGRISLEKNAAFIGRTVMVLVEGESKKGGLYTGRTPCNRVVNLKGISGMIGNEVEVPILTVTANSLRGG